MANWSPLEGAKKEYWCPWALPQTAFLQLTHLPEQRQKEPQSFWYHLGSILSISMSPLLDGQAPEHSIIWTASAFSYQLSSLSISACLEIMRQSHFAPYPWMCPHHQKLRIPRSSLILKTNPQIALYCHQLFCLHPLNPSTSWNTFTTDPLNWWPVISRISSSSNPSEGFLPFLIYQSQFKPSIPTRRENLPSSFLFPEFLVEILDSFSLPLPEHSSSTLYTIF